MKCTECNTNLSLEDEQHGICRKCQEELIMDHYKDESIVIEDQECE